MKSAWDMILKYFNLNILKEKVDFLLKRIQYELNSFSLHYFLYYFSRFKLLSFWVSSIKITKISKKDLDKREQDSSIVFTIETTFNYDKRIWYWIGTNWFGYKTMNEIDSKLWQNRRGSGFIGAAEDWYGVSGLIFCVRKLLLFVIWKNLINKNSQCYQI